MCIKGCGSPINLSIVEEVVNPQQGGEVSVVLVLGVYYFLYL